MGLRLPPGLNFCPTDQELIKFYLRNKLVVGKSLLPPEFNRYMPDKILYGEKAEEPSQLFAGRSEEYLYFFTQVNKKFVNSSNGNYMERIAGNGTWRIQKKSEVLDDNQKTLIIGYRKNFTFIPKNKEEDEEQKPEKISYIMHEFTPLKYPPSFQNHHQAAEWTVCKIRKMVTKNKDYKPPPSSSSVSSQGDQGRKRARTSSHELMLQSTTVPSTKAVMPSHQQEQKRHHPCAESLQTSTSYYNESQTGSIANQLSDTYTAAVAVVSSMVPDEVVHNLPEYSQPHQTDYFAAQPDAYEESLGGFSLADLDVPLEQESVGEVVHNLPAFSQPHQSNYVAAQPDHEDAYDEMSLFSSLDDLDVKLPPLDQDSEDDAYPLNMGQTFTGMLLADNDDTNMLPNSTM